MPKVTDEHRAARRHQIVTAALRCFARSGFQQTSMADIIAESGLSAGAIYGHYKSKEELMELAVSEILDARFLDLAQARRRDPLVSPAELVRMLVEGLTAQIGDLQLLLQVWGQVPINAKLRNLAGTIGGRIRGMFAGYLTEYYTRVVGLPPEEAEPAAEADAPLYVGLVQGYVVQSVLFEDFDRRGYLEAVERVAAAVRTNPITPVP
ncbi:TetR/AcrR family transcriptional regulator [Leifsonia shinshuensis]|uniref:TetR/AcrR family transcriptional regulator n=1 Tax=Leifsonia TaxID=110932 RepID=UPI00286345DA|nr:TetR/AcrR family transcriptional regulator [Leifsonia shinshuensis]MDR6971580.1 AcrR family transcriptional regulator [Leifsonia shinshuensis]